MVPLIDLVWPILLAATAVLLGSGVLGVLLPHRLGALHVQDGVLAGRQVAAPPGGLPLADDGLREPAGHRAAVTSRGVVARLEGRVAYHLAVNLIVAYAAGLALLPGTDFGSVLRFTAAVAFLGYGSASLQGWLVERRSWRVVWKPALMGLVSSLVAGSIFAALWPVA